MEIKKTQIDACALLCFVHAAANKVAAHIGVEEGCAQGDNCRVLACSSNMDGWKTEDGILDMYIQHERANSMQSRWCVLPVMIEALVGLHTPAAA